MRFIVIDGLDAAGKDTHAQMIKDRYEDMGEDVILRSHPSCDNPYGYRAKEALLGCGKKDKIKASSFYALDVIRSVKKYYGNADTLIFVRYLCGVAYLPKPIDKCFYDVFKTVLPTTDYKFFLDVHPRESMKRIDCRDEVEMFENLHSLRKVRNKALRLVKDWFIIDTNQPIYQAQNDINTVLDVLDDGANPDPRKISKTHSLKSSTSSYRR